MTDKLTPGHQEDAKKIVEFIGSVKPEAMKDKKQISTIPLLKILTKYAIKHAVAFSGVESNAIVEAMQEYAELWHSAKMQEVTDEGRKCLGCGTPLGDYCEQCQHLLES